jgi:hypothetical protein
LLSLLLLLSIGLVCANVYRLWKNSPWDLPVAAAPRSLPLANTPTPEAKPKPLAGTEVIVSKNLFDPERGEGRSREVESNSRAFQRVRSLVLLGTAVLGSNQYAVLRDPGPTAGALPGPGQGPAGQQATVMRMKLGDNVEGFRLSEITDKRVVFSRGTAKVEVLLDYFRKPDVPVQRPTAPVQAQNPATAPGTPPTLLPRRPVPARPGNVPQPQPIAPGGTPGQAPATQGNVPPPAITPVPAPGQAVTPGQIPLAPRVLPNLPRRERVPVQPNQNQSEE